MPRTKKGRALDKKRNRTTPVDVVLRNGRHQAHLTSHSTAAHLTMHEEARNTGGRNLWRPGSLLRHQAVQFVSAGALQPTDPELPHQTPSVNRTIDEPQPVIESATTTPAQTIDSNITDDGTPFLIDLIGEAAPETGMADPITNIVSDESSEDEIVFHGRKKWSAPSTRLLDDHTEIRINSQDSTRRKSQNASKPPATASAEMSANDTPPALDNCQETSVAEANSTKDSSECTDTEKQQPEKQYADNIFDGEFDIFTDYISNMDDVYRPEDEEDMERSQTSTTPKRQSTDALDDMESQSSNSYDSEFDVDLDELDILEELSLQDRGQRNLTQQRLAKKLGNKFASATAFADALESDPYYGFDIMDFDRPSLRKKSKAKRHVPDFELSDPELEMELVRAWQNDREKKKTRKQKREELRSRGLLGRKIDNADLTIKYANGIGPEELRTEIHTFLLTPRNSLPLPPMPKQRRKVIHDLANVLSLISKSRGKGASRFPILHKTSRTPEYSEKTVLQINRILSAGSFKSRPTKQNVAKISKSRRGQPGGSVSYMDGDIVGASAPEIGVENKGRAMLEKMGWSTGTALGASNNKGILLPVAHVVKNSKAGLG
ncbi:putative R3H and G-patch domain protein [Aspergillus melleus]|uniref:putative R3H and G-patch domain protein n=1 Tax=Aspergillus melleus TaxID=138277 RepID=UPI001E8D6039|nr:squalene synthetase-like protein [Aspergillus melleus]KAH8428892.1 squalene synthetase-like protein [Aspergillus melleus]